MISSSIIDLVVDQELFLKISEMIIVNGHLCI